MTHGLLLSEPLWAEDLSEAASERSRWRAEHEPTTGIQRVRARQTRTDGLARARERRRAENPGYVFGQDRALVAPAVDAAAAGRAAERDRRAQAAGYASWEDVIRSTVDVPTTVLAAQFGYSGQVVFTSRRRYLGADWRNRYTLTHATTTAAVRAAGYPDVATGILDTWWLTQKDAATRLGITPYTVRGLRLRLPVPVTLIGDQDRAAGLLTGVTVVKDHLIFTPTGRIHTPGVAPDTIPTARRAAYECWISAIPDEVLVVPACGEPGCIAPAHLTPVGDEGC